MPAGRDSLQLIGHPPGLEGVKDRERLNEAWARTFQARAPAHERAAAPCCLARLRSVLRLALHCTAPPWLLLCGWLARRRAKPGRRQMRPAPLPSRPPKGAHTPASRRCALGRPLVGAPQDLFPPSAESQRLEGREKKKHVVDSEAYAEESVDVLRIQKLKELTQRAARSKAEAAAEAAAAASRGAGQSGGLR